MIGSERMNQTVAYRLPRADYEQALALAGLRGIRMSSLLREATARGLEALAGDDNGRKPQSQDKSRT